MWTVLYNRASFDDRFLCTAFPLSNPSQQQHDAQPNGPPSRFERWGLMLRSAEQMTIVGVLLISAVVICGYVVFLNTQHGGLIDVDELEYRQVHFAVDINCASWPELANIPDVGRKLAETIVQFRSEAGPFTSIEDLEQVPGIGPSTLETLRPHLLPIVPTKLNSK